MEECVESDARKPVRLSRYGTRAGKVVIPNPSIRRERTAFLMVPILLLAASRTEDTPDAHDWLHGTRANHSISLSPQRVEPEHLI
jgi:hypothetical protein